MDDNREIALPNGLSFQAATKQNVTHYIEKELAQSRHDLLYFYWGGHGVMTTAGERRLFYADATIANKKNLDLNLLLTFLRTDYFPARTLSRQIVIVDACANYVTDMKTTKDLPQRTFPNGEPLENHEQYVLMAAKPGEYAKNIDAEKTCLVAHGVVVGMIVGVARVISAGIAGGVVKNLAGALVGSLISSLIFIGILSLYQAPPNFMEALINLSLIFLLGYSRLPLYPIEALWQIICYTLQRTTNLSTLRFVPVLYHNLSFLPHPFLAQHIILGAKTEPELAKQVINACALSPGQYHTGQVALARLYTDKPHIFPEPTTAP